MENDFQSIMKSNIDNAVNKTTFNPTSDDQLEIIDTFNDE